MLERTRVSVRSTTLLLGFSALSAAILLVSKPALAAGPGSSSGRSSGVLSARAGSVGIGSLRVFTNKTVEATHVGADGSKTTHYKQGIGVAIVPKGAEGTVRGKGLVSSRLAIEKTSASGQLTSTIEGRTRTTLGKQRTAWGGDMANGSRARGVVTMTRGKIASTWNVANPRAHEYSKGSSTTVDGKTETTASYTKVHSTGATESAKMHRTASGVTTTSARHRNADGHVTRETETVR